jgi:hypothetical protein
VRKRNGGQSFYSEPPNAEAMFFAIAHRNGFQSFLIAKPEKVRKKLLSSENPTPNHLVYLYLTDV